MSCSCSYALPPRAVSLLIVLLVTLLVVTAALVALARPFGVAASPAPWQAPQRLQTVAGWLLVAGAVIVGYLNLTWPAALTAG